MGTEPYRLVPSERLSR